MSDIFREVDEDLRREQYKRLWDRFAPYVFVVAALIVLGTAGYRGWVYWQETQAQASGDAFMAAMRQASDGDRPGAIAALEELTRSGHGGYPVVAQFGIATQKGASGDRDGAVAAFDAIAASNAPVELRTLAQLRAAMLLADTISLEEMQGRIGNLAAIGNSWRATARELLGLVAWRTSNTVAARGYFEDIVSDQESPPDARQRVQILLALMDQDAPATESGTDAEVAPPPPPVTDDAGTPAE